MPRLIRPMLAAALVLGLAVTPAKAQVAVVSVKSFDDFMADAKFVMTLAGQAERFKQLEGVIDALTGGKGFTGVDTKRPIGAFINAPKNGGAEPQVVVFVPVTKEDDFLQLLKDFNIEADKPDKGVFPLTAPNGEKFYLRFAYNYAFGAKDAEHVSGDLPDPAKAIPAIAKNYLLTAQFRVADLPKELKKQFLDEVAKGIESEKEKKPNETEAQYQGRLAGMKMAKEAITMLVEETKDLTLGFAVDQKKPGLALDLALTPKAGSPLAASIKSFGEARSVFSAFANDSAASLLLNIPLAEELQKQFAKLFEEGFKEGLGKVEDPKQRELAEKVLKTLQESFRKDAIDVAAALKGPFDDKKYALVAGLRVKDGKKLEQLVKDLVKELPADERAKIKLDAHKIGKDLVHTLDAGKGDEQAERLFGKVQIFVVFRDDMALVTIGEHGLKVMTDALAAVDKGGVKAGAPIQLELSIAKLMMLSDDKDKMEELTKKLFQGEDKDKDKVRVTVTGGEALKLRVDVDGNIIKLIGELLSPLLGG